MHSHRNASVRHMLIEMVFNREDTRGSDRDGKWRSKSEKDARRRGGAGRGRQFPLSSGSSSR